MKGNPIWQKPWVRIWTAIDNFHCLRTCSSYLSHCYHRVILFSSDKGRCKPYRTGSSNSRFWRALYSELDLHQWPDEPLRNAIPLPLFYWATWVMQAFCGILSSRSWLHTHRASLLFPLPESVRRLWERPFDWSTVRRFRSMMIL